MIVAYNCYYGQNAPYKRAERRLELSRWRNQSENRGALEMTSQGPQERQLPGHFWSFHSLIQYLLTASLKTGLHTSAQKFAGDCQHFNFRLKGREDNDCRIKMLPDGDQSGC